MTARRVAIYVAADNYIKIVGPFIDYLVRTCSQEFAVVVLLPRWGGKAAPVNAEVFSRAWGERVDVRELPDVDALGTLMKRGEIDALVSLQPALAGVGADDFRRLRAIAVTAGVKWIALPDGFSQDRLLVAAPVSTIQHWDLVCTVGKRSMRYIDGQLQSMAAEVARALRGRIAVVGYPEFDGIAALDAAPVIRQRYGIPSGKPVLFVATAPRLFPQSISSRTGRGLQARFSGERDWSPAGLAARAVSLRYPTLVTYRQYLAALRAFADANGMFIVAKTRAKHRDPGFVRDYADAFVADESFFPFTTLELMRVSSLYFGFYSSSVAEAAVSGVYAITSLFLPPRVAEPNAGWRDASRHYKWGDSGIWATPGMSTVIDGTTAAGRQAVARLATGGLDDYHVDQERLAAVLLDTFGYPGSSSARVVDAMRSCLDAPYHADVAS